MYHFDDLLEGAHKPDEFIARLYKKVFVDNKIIEQQANKKKNVDV